MLIGEKKGSDNLTIQTKCIVLELDSTALSGMSKPGKSIRNDFVLVQSKSLIHFIQSNSDVEGSPVTYLFYTSTRKEQSAKKSHPALVKNGCTMTC